MSSPTARLSGTSLGVLNIIQKSIFVITTTGACSATLQDGYESQRILLYLLLDGGDLTVTGTFALGSTATFDAVRDAVELIWISGIGWHVISNSSVVFA